MPEQVSAPSTTVDVSWLELARGLADKERSAQLRSDASPAIDEVLGTRIAELVREFSPDVVVCWDTIESAALTHVAARELGVDRLTIEVDLGVLNWRTPLPLGARTILVDASWGEYPGLDPIVRMVERAGGLVVAVASVTGDISTTSVAEAAPDAAVFILGASGPEVR